MQSHETKMDNVILGGGIANTCLLAQGFSIGSSLVEESMLEEALELANRNNVILPKMVVTAENPQQKGTIKNLDNIQEDESIFDIAPESFEEQQDLFQKAIQFYGMDQWACLKKLPLLKELIK